MKYEMLYLIDASVADEPRDALIERFGKIVTDLGGKVLSTDKWGVKKTRVPHRLQERRVLRPDDVRSGRRRSQRAGQGRRHHGRSDAPHDLEGELTGGAA